MAVGQVEGSPSEARVIRRVGTQGSVQAGNHVAAAAREGGLTNRILLVALALGGAVDILFYGKATGISTLVFVGLMVTALAVLGIMERVRVAWRNIWLALPLLFFAGMVAVRDNPELTLMNLGSTGLLLLLFVYFFSGGRVEALGILGYPLTAVLMLGQSLRRPAPLAVGLARRATSNRGQNHRIFEVVRGLLIALPILLVFTLLLSQADSIFQGLVDDLMRMRFLTDAPEAGLRISIILLSSWAIAGGLMHALKPPAAVTMPSSGPQTVPLRKRGLSYVEGAMVLALVNGLFAVFAWIQFTVLFSGQAARSMGFEEYREYVRRGFGELLVVAMLTMALILGLRRAMRRSTEGQERNLNILNTVMIGLATVLLVSAFSRMVVWENIDFYISTATRLYVRTFIVCLGGLFLWLLFTTWFRRDRFGIGALMAGVAFVVAANWINPDAEVAAHNLRRNDELSTRYLYLLSDDAVPALVAGLDTTTGNTRRQLQTHLRARLQEMEQNRAWQNWQSYHLSRWEAYNVLLEAMRKGQLYE